MVRYHNSKKMDTTNRMMTHTWLLPPAYLMRPSRRCSVVVISPPVRVKSVLCVLVTGWCVGYARASRRLRVSVRQGTHHAA